MRETDILIIGSGPAGVSAAWPLVFAGLSVTMIDAGTGKLPFLESVGLREELTFSPATWRAACSG